MCVLSLGAWAPQLPTGYFVPGRTQEPAPLWCCLPYPALTVCGGVFQTPSGHTTNGRAVPAGTAGRPSNPTGATAAALARAWFGLIPVRSPLLREYCLFLGLREMFQLARCPPREARYLPKQVGCPIRKSWDQSVLAAPPRVSSRCHVRLRHTSPRHPSSAPIVLPELRHR